MNERKAIQLILSEGGNLIALCDDGTLWIGRGGMDALEWSKINAPPETGNGR